MQSCKMTMLCAIVVCCIVCCGPGRVKADIVENLESVVIHPGEYYNVSLYLAQDELLYARFRITYGEGIYFFIVDQNGQDAIMNGSEPTTRHEERTISADEAQLNMIFFHVTHDSTWYVWFSKVSGVPFADSAVTIEGRVGWDTDGPVILETHIPDGPLTGITEVNFRVRDDGFLIYVIELHANDKVVAVTGFNSYHETREINGSEAEGAFFWDTTKYENSVYVLKIVAYDGLGHVSESAGVLRTVNNTFWNYTVNRQIVTVGAILCLTTFTVLGYARYKKITITRHYAKGWIVRHRTWIQFILLLLLVLYISLSSRFVLLF